MISSLSRRGLFDERVPRLKHGVSWTRRVSALYSHGDRRGPSTYGTLYLDHFASSNCKAMLPRDHYTHTATYHPNPLGFHVRRYRVASISLVSRKYSRYPDGIGLSLISRDGRLERMVRPVQDLADGLPTAFSERRRYPTL
jgi:hypothetical protein